MQLLRKETLSLARTLCRPSFCSSSYRMLKRELRENPEFDKAFPHLKALKHPSRLEEENQEVDFIDSLTDEHRVYERSTEEQIEAENTRRYVDGYRSPQGPLKYMSEKAIREVDILAEKRMEELESLHCSREQILFGVEQGGVKLVDDPFFQYIKNSREARQVVIKAGEEYSVRRIVDVALRQDIGLDKAQSNEKYIQNVSQEGYHNHFSANLKDPHMYVQEMKGSRYYGADQKIDVDQFRMLFDQNKKYHLRQMKRSEHRKLTKQQLNSNDVDWRNTELLTKFLQHSGQIKNRYQTKLSQKQQRLVSRHVKTARQMLLLPYIGNIRANNRKSLRTLQEDVEDYTRQLINVDSGSLYFKNQKNPEREKAQMEAFLGQETSEGHAQKAQAVRENTDLELNFMPPMPDQEQLGLLSAQIYAKKLKEVQLVNQGEDLAKLKGQAEQPVDYDNPLFQELEQQEVPLEIDNQVLEQSYQHIKGCLHSAQGHSQLASLFLGERALAMDKVKAQQEEQPEEKTVEQLKEELAGLKKSLGL